MQRSCLLQRLSYLLFAVLLLPVVALISLRQTAVSVHAAPAATWTVTKTADTNDGTCDADCSLREAIEAASAGGTIDFALTTPATITVNSPLVIGKSLTITGPGPDQLFLSGNDTTAVLWINEGQSTLSGLTVTRGDGGSGGGIDINSFNTALPQTVVTLTQVHLTHNNAIWGGGMSVDNSMLFMYDSQLHNNVASLRGGGMSLAYTATASLVNVSFHDNEGDLGGALEVDNDSYATLQHIDMEGNNATYSGGGISLSGNSEVVLESGQIVANNGTYFGGGVVLFAGSVFTQTGGLIAYNTGQYGGGIAVGDPNGPGTAVIQGGTIFSNTATFRGGGIAVYENSSLTLTAGLIQENLSDSYGGGIDAEDGQLWLNGATIISNSADYGGGISLRQGGQLTMTAGQVQANTAATHGGGIYARSNTTVHFSGGTVLTNTTNGSGGGFSLWQNSQFTMTGGLLANNSSTMGGGIYTFDSHTNIVTGTIAANTANYGGGIAIFGSSSAFTLANGQIISNTALYIGGGIYANAGSTMINGGNIANNQATYLAGGLYVGGFLAPQVWLSGGAIANNQDPNGSGVVLEPNGVMTMTNPFTIQDDVEVSGILQAATHPLTITGSLFQRGGLINAPATLSITEAFTHTAGTFRQTKAVAGSEAVGFPKAGGVLINAAGAGDLGSTDVVIRAGADCLATPGATVRHCYTITPTNQTAVSPTLTFFYQPAALGAHQCDTVNAYYWDGSWSHLLVQDNTYNSDGRSCAAAPYSLRATGVEQFGEYVLASTLVSINDNAVPEGDVLSATVIFSVTRTGAHGPSSIDYATADNTAQAGSDYAAVSTTTLNFAPDQTALTLTVPISGDTIYELDETYFINLSNPVGTAVADGQGVLLIDNDDFGPTGLGPGGVGTPDGLTALELWLRSDKGIVLAEGQVRRWDDYSQSNHPAIQAYEVARPTYRPNGLNGQPVLGLDSDTLPLGDLSADFPSEATLFVAATLTDSNEFGLYATTNIWPNYYWRYWDGTSRFSPFRTNYVTTYPPAFPSSGSHIFSLQSNATTYELFRNGISQGALPGSYSAGDNHCVGCSGTQGDIAEVIAFNTSLNQAQRSLVENYLAAKYDIPLTAGDHYAGDTAGNGHYDWDVAGIGQESDGQNSVAHSAGLIISDTGYLQDDGDYLLAGHALSSNGITASDLPIDTAVSHRWQRAWYLDKQDANGNGGPLNLTFDFNEGEPGITASGVFTLLYRATTTTPFTTVMTQTAQADQVHFTLEGNGLNNGYYSLGACLQPANVTDLSISNQDPDAAFTWSPVLANEYRLLAHPSNAYFQPGDSNQIVVDTTMMTSTVHTGSIGTNYFYLLQPRSYCGDTAVSNRVGAFNYALEPGG